MSITQRWDRSTPRPLIGSRWIWEPGNPDAEVAVLVEDVRWNGEEWWVYLRDPNGQVHPNEAARFWQAVL